MEAIVPQNDPADMGELYRIVNDPQYNAMRVCLLPDPGESPLAFPHITHTDNKSAGNDGAKLGRDAE
jgi:hypothetical protein